MQQERYWRQKDVKAYFFLNFHVMLYFISFGLLFLQIGNLLIACVWIFFRHFCGYCENNAND